MGKSGRRAGAPQHTPPIPPGTVPVPGELDVTAIVDTKIISIGIVITKFRWGVSCIYD